MTNHAELTKSEKINLNIKDIAKAVRASLKAKHPNCKFSVTIERYAGGQSMTVALMAAPFEAFATDKPIHGEGYAQVNHYYLKEQTYLTEQARGVIADALEIVQHYNYDDSDMMTDYHSVNFSMDFRVGKWDKPFNNTSKIDLSYLKINN